MGKWKITGISLAVLIIAGVIFVNSPWLIAAAFYFLQPSESFANTVPPTAPNYNDTAYWASLPGKEDAADFLPAELSSDQNAKRDVAKYFDEIVIRSVHNLICFLSNRRVSLPKIPVY